MASPWNQSFTAAPSSSATTFGNPFFQQGNSYGGDRDWNTTPLAGQIREQNPQLAFAQYGQQQGIGDADSAFNQWFYQQYPRFQRAYGMATLQNPLITIDEFVRTLPSLAALRQQYGQLAPEQRGERAGVYAPVARWLNR